MNFLYLGTEAPGITIFSLCWNPTLSPFIIKPIYYKTHLLSPFIIKTLYTCHSLKKTTKNNQPSIIISSHGRWSVLWGLYVQSHRSIASKNTSQAEWICYLYFRVSQFYVQNSKGNDITSGDLYMEYSSHQGLGYLPDRGQWSLLRRPSHKFHLLG